jgi:hypothetical protein
MTDKKKCANPACTCIPIGSESHCSAHCEAAKGTTEIMCQCGHASCGGDASKA